MRGERKKPTGGNRSVYGSKPRRAPGPRAVSPIIRQALAGETLVDCLLRKGADPKAVAMWVETLEAPRVEVRRERLLRESRRMARGFVRHGVRPRDRVLLVLPTGADFVYCFLGILLAGATPVPAYPPAGISKLPAFWGTLRRMATAVQGRLIVVPELLRELAADGANGAVAVPSLVVPEEIQAAGKDRTALLPAPPAADDLALVQFSSGSTGDPRGVCLTHTNVLSNIRGFLSRLRAQPEDVSVSWLPLYHDMGLIGTMLGTLMSGMTLVLMPPTDFLRQPDQWLRLIGKYGATLSVAPQFAYNLCVRKADPVNLKGVDLSSLRVILNGAEPILVEGVAAFEKKYRPLGLRPGVVTPCYGLAEGTLAASMRSPGSSIRCVPLPGAGTARKKVAAVVSVGPPLDGTEVRIRGPRGRALGERRVGEISLRSDSISVGQLDGKGLVPLTDARGWLATGDLGFLDEGELFVTGRKKDLIIIGGRNLYPHDLEAAIGDLPGLRPGRIVAFGITEPDRATEVLVIVAETQGLKPDEGASCVVQLRQVLLGQFGAVPYDTVLLERGQLPLTTSGKLRRSQTRTNYLRGSFTDPLFQVRAAGAAVPAPPPSSV